MVARPRREVQNVALTGVPGSALSALVPPKSAPGAPSSPDVSDVEEVSDASDVSPAPALRVEPKRSKPPARRDPTKVDAQLLQQMRNLTACIRGKGHPMAELGELLDEALSEYLERKRHELNGGEDFPDVGRLR